MIGIYKIENITNRKVYIGSSQDISSRWENHINLLLNNKHISSMQDDFNLTGITNFVFSIIELTEISDIKKREEYWISFYKSFNPDNGYNRMPQSNASTKISQKLKPKVEVIYETRRPLLTPKDVKEIFKLSELEYILFLPDMPKVIDRKGGMKRFDEEELIEWFNEKEK